MAGSLVYVAFLQWIPEDWAMLAGTAAVFVIRMLASTRRWDLPVYVLEPREEDGDEPKGNGTEKKCK